MAVKPLRYELAAIMDWKEGKITTGKLLYLFEVTWDGYRELHIEANKAIELTTETFGNVLNLPAETIAQVLNRVRVKELNRTMKTKEEE